MKVDGAIANLLQGISQQQPGHRLPGQCTAQLNAVNDVVDGWKRRPPTEYIAVLLGIYDTHNSKWHFYDTGVEQYLICISSNGSMWVFDLLGNNYPVVGAVNYVDVLSFTNPQDISLVTIGDYTIIANSKLIPAMHVGFTEVYSSTAIVYLKDGGEYGRTYTISLDGVEVARYVSPGGSDPATESEQTGTEYVTTALYNMLVSTDALTLDVRSNYTYTRASSIIEVTRVTGNEDIIIGVTDDRGGQFAKIIQRSVIKSGDLPKFATPGQIVQVTGDGSSDKDDYYLKFTIEHGEQVFGVEGVWRECCAPGIERKFSAATMPHALIRLPDGTWRLTPIDGTTYDYVGGVFQTEHWLYRSAGSETTNGIPAFIGKSISYLGTFQDRLFMLSDENAVFSATDSYFNFFNKTALTILDSDPVDMPSAGNAIVKLTSATQHDKNLIIFADKAQFVVPGTKELTPKSSMILTTSYDSDLLACPVPAGAGVLFPITYGDFGGVREFITSQATSDTNTSQPITAHVPKLIKGSVKSMSVSSNFDILLLQSTLGANSIYVYKYLWQDGQRQQASWGIWEYDPACTIASMFIKDAYVYLVLKGADAVHRIERMDLTDAAATGMPCNVYLDSLLLIQPEGNTITLPYLPVDASSLVVVQGADCAYPGEYIQVYSAVNQVLTLAEFPAGKCYVGSRYTSSYTPTMPVIKDANGGTITNVNFILSKFLISYKNTGDIQAIVRNPYYEDYTTGYYGRTLGTLVSRVGAASIDTGVLAVPVRKDAKHTTLELTTNSHLPMNLETIEWVGDYTKTGRRL